MGEKYLTKDGLLLTEEISRDLKEQFEEDNNPKRIDIKDYIQSHEVRCEESTFYSCGEKVFTGLNYYIGVYEIKVDVGSVIGTRSGGSGSYR